MKKITFFNVLLLLLLIVGYSRELCTPGSCLYCDNDGGTLFCNKCGNRKVLSGKYPDIYCGGSIKMSNCWAADGLNEEKCITCVRGYYLTSENKCVKIPIHKCLVAEEVSKKIFCTLCDGMNLTPDFQKCESKNKLPKNCMSGNINGKGCILCEQGYYPETYSRECTKNTIEGCGIYDTEKNCLECETFHGYYAVSSVFRNGRIF